MLFTRTIRRKMVFGLCLVLIMLIIVSVGGLSGLTSYRQVVADLEYSINEAPRRADLVAAIGSLNQPLLLTPPENRTSPRFHRFRQKAFQDQMGETRDRILEYRRKLDRLPLTREIVGRRPITEDFLQEIDRRMAELDKLQATMMINPKGDETIHEMLTQVGHLSSVALQVPDYRDGLNEKLQTARKVYGSRFRLLCWTTGVGIVLFGMLVRYVYKAIFSPLSTLHQGALRVAHGNFEFRVVAGTNDEMSELAEAFNKMTARFQEIRQDLDRQVRERSKQLVRSERLAGLGFLAAGVAHEINNPLQAIMVAAESLEGRSVEFLAAVDPGDADVVRQYLGMIRGEAFRCKEITARLLNFARGHDSKRGRFDLTLIIEEVLGLVSHLGKFKDRKIEFTPGAPCPLEVNGPEIKQVVLNMVSNALESMESGRTLKIELTEQMDQVVITFRDQGCGMTPEVIENLFEPFFTQRKDGKGTGLGLSISHRIVSEHGGTIEALSDGPGAGSTFHIHLPRKAVVQELAA